MRNRSKAAVAVLISSLAGGGTAAAGVPATITQQGRLYDAQDVPENKTLAVTFQLYAGLNDAVSIWSETDMITFSEGYFSVALGAVTPFETGATPTFDGTTRYLGITVGADPEMKPRAAVASVPYAMLAGDVNGAIHPTSVSIAGVGPVIDATGTWVGNAANLVGPQGPQGLPGVAGPQGVTGGQGVAGPAGPPGVAGTAGPQGVTGQQGATGQQGPLGPTGPQGATGAVGAQGPQGPAGTPGSTGATGATGATGPTNPAAFIQNQTASAQAASFDLAGTGQLQSLTVNGNVTVGGRVALGVYTNTCAPNTAPFDCPCNAGDTAVGGGGFAFVGGGNVLRETAPTPGNPGAWRVTCAVVNGGSASFDNQCQGAYAVCLSHGQ